MLKEGVEGLEGIEGVEGLKGKPLNFEPLNFQFSVFSFQFSIYTLDTSDTWSLVYNKKSRTAVRLYVDINFQFSVFNFILGSTFLIPNYSKGFSIDFNKVNS